MTTADVVQEFRDESFSISGSFSYELTEGDAYRDVIQDGEYQSTSGHILWEGPQLGIGSFVGIATGDGNDFFRAGGGMRACSSYGIEDEGELIFDVDALAQSLQITENNLHRTAYTYYVDHTGGNCPEPVPPWSRFFGGMTNLYVGSFDAANSTASIGYRQSDPDLEINAPAAEVVWENNKKMGRG